MTNSLFELCNLHAPCLRGATMFGWTRPVTRSLSRRIFEILIDKCNALNSCTMHIGVNSPPFGFCDYSATHTLFVRRTLWFTLPQLFSVMETRHTLFDVRRTLWFTHFFPDFDSFINPLNLCDGPTSFGLICILTTRCNPIISSRQTNKST